MDKGQRRWEYRRIEGETWTGFEAELARADAEGWEVAGFSAVDKGGSYYSVALMKRKARTQGASVGWGTVDV